MRREDIKAEDLINWSKLSECLTGNATTIRRNYIPKKYRADIKELIDMINYWLQKPRKP